MKLKELVKKCNDFFDKPADMIEICSKSNIQHLTPNQILLIFNDLKVYYFSIKDRRIVLDEPFLYLNYIIVHYDDDTRDYFLINHSYSLNELRDRIKYEKRQSSAPPAPRTTSGSVCPGV